MSDQAGPRDEDRTGTNGAEADHRPDAQRSGFSRRSFLTATGTLAAATVIPGCTPTAERLPAEGEAAEPQAGTDVPENTAAAAGTLGRFLDPEQLALVTAVAARIIPGDEDEPGAVEAGCVEYIDRLLATHDGYPERTYTSPPFAVTYEGDEEPEPEEGVIWVRADQIDRYGWQSGLPPREIYRMGLARLDALAQQREGSGFADLADDRQDAILEAIEDGEDDVGELFDPLPPGTFFDTIRTHLIEGFLSDPIYGGNRDLVGWQHTQFPGSQRGYSPQELLDPNFSRPPQGISELPMMHAGHRHDEGGAALASLRRRHPNGPVD